MANKKTWTSTKIDVSYTGFYFIASLSQTLKYGVIITIYFNNMISEYKNHLILFLPGVILKKIVDNSIVMIIVFHQFNCNGHDCDKCTNCYRTSENILIGDTYKHMGVLQVHFRLMKGVCMYANGFRILK